MEIAGALGEGGSWAWLGQSWQNWGLCFLFPHLAYDLRLYGVNEITESSCILLAFNMSVGVVGTSNNPATLLVQVVQTKQL